MSFLKSNFKIIKTVALEKDFSFLFLSLSLFLLPWSINLSTFALILALCFKIYQVIFLKQKLFTVKRLKYSSIIGLFFIIYILLNSIIQSNVYYTISAFEVEYSHLLLLVLVPLLLRKKNENIILCYLFFLGLTLACLYVFIMSFILNLAFNKHAFSSILDIHHTYVSMYLLFFVNFIFVTFFNKAQFKNNYKKILLALIVVLSFSIIFILASKVSIVIFAILLGAYLLVTFSKNNALIYVFIFFVLISSLFLFNKNISTTYKNALDFRLEIWQESLNSIKEYPFFGNLKMPEKDILNLRHYISGKYYLKDSDLNSHNQYLSVFLKYGLFGFLFLMLFGINLINALNKSTSKSTIKETLGFSVIVLITFYIENLLDRHHGIVFCAIFYNYYLAAIQNEDI